MLNEENKDEMGRLIDRLENLCGAMVIPMPDKFHLDNIKVSLPEIVEKMKVHFEDIVGEKIWNN
jgi:hypothetical protein